MRSVAQVAVQAQETDRVCPVARDGVDRLGHDADTSRAEVPITGPTHVVTFADVLEVLAHGLVSDAATRRALGGDQRAMPVQLRGLHAAPGVHDLRLVGDVALRAGLPVHELRALEADLEATFFSLTEGTNRNLGAGAGADDSVATAAPTDTPRTAAQEGIDQ